MISIAARRRIKSFLRGQMIEGGTYVRAEDTPTKAKTRADFPFISTRRAA